MAKQCTIVRRPGLFGRTVSAQAAHPRGVLGRVIGRRWVSETAAANDRAMALLAVAAGEHVLEVGFGPGRTVQQLAASGARVTGIDVSPVMLAQARRRNTAAIDAGQVDLLIGHAGAMALPDASVDAVLAVHTLYFWAELTAGLREARRVLRPGGRVVLAFRSADSGLPRRFDPAVYHVPTVRAVERAIADAGFDPSATERDPHGVTYTVAHTPSGPVPAPARTGTAGHDADGSRGEEDGRGEQR